ncbi:hypothetical protein [Paenibacillus massiliensis]|uniref:hypothetical protein n=1 Tax=Paenibacillus massiliensis TaxID=225917 RepID=UPI000428684E|nr:hypothetical protein [Paenibacillus massiliensis]
MKTSSFFMGVVLGAVASSVVQRRNMRNLNHMMHKARTKLMDAALPGMAGLDNLNLGKDKSHSRDKNQHEHTVAHEHERHETHTSHSKTSQPLDKETNLRLIKEFIRSTPDVKKEVEMILKETNTAIPGI